MTEYDINPSIWFSNREVNFLPKHFTLASTPLTMESRQWVLDNLHGRFAIIQTGQVFLIPFYIGDIAFEDPKDATFYELKWS